MIVGVRHAQVWNPDGVVYARLEGFGLSRAGRQAARDLAAALSSSPVRRVAASPQRRALETAACLAQPHGLTVAVDARLAEWAFWGRWAGLPWTRIRDRSPELLDAYAEDPGSVTAGESLEAAGRRVTAWAEEQDMGATEGLVLGVTHEAPLLSALLLGNGLGLSGYHAYSLTHLATVRLLPGPPEAVDLAGWATAC